MRAANRSYIFFRVTGLTNEGEPLGAQGVPLTPGRSIAVDRVHRYGTPFFIEADLPLEGRKAYSPFRRLMIAQDTGSAIVGPARADLYWGAGEEAGRIAGRIRHPGRFVMLLPRRVRHRRGWPRGAVAVAETEDRRARSRERGRQGQGGVRRYRRQGQGRVGWQRRSRRRQDHFIAATQTEDRGARVNTQDNRGKAALKIRKQDDKGKANSANAGASTAGRQMPSPLPNTKIAVLDDEKHDSNARQTGRPASPSCCRC